MWGGVRGNARLFSNSALKTVCTQIIKRNASSGLYLNASELKTTAEK